MTDAAEEDADAQAEPTPKKQHKFTQPPTRASHYLVGSALDDALSSDPSGIEVVEPYERGLVVNWSALEALWRHILFTEFKIKRHRNECPVILTLPAFWSKYYHERVAQMFFERFNVPALYILDQPLAELYAVGQLSGIVVDIGWEKTDITPVLDTAIQYTAVQKIPIGARHMQGHLLKLLKTDPTLSSDPVVDADFARFVMESQTCEIQVDDAVVVPTEEKEDEGVADVAKIVAEGREKDFVEKGVEGLSADAKKELAAKERVDLEYKGKTYSIGPVRHRVAEPLFDASLFGTKGDLSVPEGVNTAVMACDWDRRQFLWDNVVITGDIVQIKGLTTAIYAALTPFVVSSDSETQAHNVRVLKIPDYFSTMKESPHMASFLGSNIVAKLAFQDASSRYFISKIDYHEKGPSVVHSQ